MALDSKAILAADDVRLEKLHVPEWKGDVHLRVISGTDRDRFEESYSEQKMKAFRVRFLLLTLCDSKGERLFKDEDADALGKKSSVVINRLFDAAWKLNAFSPEAVDEMGEIFRRRPEKRFHHRLALALGMSVKRLLQEVDSREMAAWFAYDQRWPLPDHWQQTARVCRIIMAASGNYKKKDIPDEAVFIPTAKRPEQTQAAMISELMKLQQPQG